MTEIHLVLSRFRATYFSLLVQRKVGKRKHFSPTQQSRCGIAMGIFRFAILGESKNGGRPARRPMGLVLRQWFAAK
ncbi:MAG: hypothetical protein IT473_16105 [Lysobacter sp.]|nr:hypothetical protein [Lysobacter sp.]